MYFYLPVDMMVSHLLSLNLIKRKCGVLIIFLQEMIEIFDPNICVPFCKNNPNLEQRVVIRLD